MTRRSITTQQLITRRYKRRDEFGISKLMKIVFPRYYSSNWLEHFYWQQTNPFGRNIRWVAECNGKIVGHIARIPLPIKIGKETLKGSIAADAATHPNFRRRGIYKTLSVSSWNDAIRDGIVVSFADASRMLISPARRYGILDISKIAILVNPLNPCAIIEKRLGQGLLAKAVSRGIGTTLKLFAITKKKAKIEGLKTSKISAFDDRIDTFWDTVSRFYGIIVARNKAYLNWKYFKRPHLSFDVFLAEVGEAVLGYTVLSTIVEDGFKKGLIVDLMTYPTGTDVMQCLISLAMQHFKKTGVDSIECWMLKNNPCYKSLIRQGFFSPPTFLSGTDLVARVVSSKVSEAFVRDSRNWYTTLGDYY
ncbi:MAG: GNAT family N-acetyltransferase [Candidatus Bathyarchaeia archaeon]